jgi:dTDP-4-dehydrorhamnose 3,5-epimerase
MKLKKTKIPDLFVLVPDKHLDNRGLFFEDFKIINDFNFVFYQQNISVSSIGVLRGLHLQLENSQAKIISVINGSIYDVVIDLRQNSKTFGEWYSVILSDSNFQQLYVPKGFAHGFLALEDNTRVLYKVDDKYNPKSEITIKWDDPDLNIIWPIRPKLISEKDIQGISFKEFKELNYSLNNEVI